MANRLNLVQHGNVMPDGITTYISPLIDEYPHFLTMSNFFPNYSLNRKNYKDIRELIPTLDYLKPMEGINSGIELYTMHDGMVIIFDKAKSFIGNGKCIVIMTKKPDNSHFHKFLEDIDNKINSYDNEDSLSFSYYKMEKGEIKKTQLSRELKTFATCDYFYPYLNVPNLLDSFLNAREKILILFGAPGTGKSSLIKRIITEIRNNHDPNKTKDIVYVKDTNVLDQDSFWVDLLEEQPYFLILDDLDIGLSDRRLDEAKGKKSFASNMLSFSDGVLDVKTKIMITTNQDLSQIDQAIVRPGRCFDILRLRELKNAEAKLIWEKELKMDNFATYFNGNENISPAEMASLYDEIKDHAANKSKSYLEETHISELKKYNAVKKNKVGFG